jgi:para-nitrobenzyl esterase
MTMLSPSFCRGIVLNIALCALLIAGSVTAQTAPVVVIEQGKIIGMQEQGRMFFRGIPYAKAPIGELRWQKPQGAPAFSGEFTANQYGPVCPQFNEINSAEDCLTINIAAPASAMAHDNAAKLPVLVWIHGGGFVNGSGNLKTTGTKLWNDNGVIVVSFNYRLGPLGFFAHPLLNSAHGANYGLLDMVAALKWVQTNIAAFGGDAQRVTIAGMSAGAMAVQMLMTSPLSKGLFWAAIAQSGYGTWPLPHSTHGAKSGQRAQDFAQQVLTKVSSENAANLSTADLYKLSAEQWVQAVSGFMLPIVDDYSLLDEPGITFSQGKQHAVPYVTGANSFDGSVFPYSGLEEGALKQLMGSQLTTLERLYALTGPTADTLGIAQLFGDARYALAAKITSEHMYKVQQPAYRYWFDYVRDGSPNAALGASHGAETGALFYETTHPAIVTMRQYWLNFIKTSSPNDTTLPHWPVVNSQQQAWLVIRQNISVEPSIRVEKFEALTAAYQQRIALH